MDTRKIQTVGGGTYTVSLPKEWAESQDIDSGDTVSVHPHIDGILVIQAQEHNDGLHQRAAITVERADAPALERTLRAAYAAGVKKLVLDADQTFTAEQTRTIHRIVRNLTGMSVVEDTDSAITIRSLLDTGNVSIQQSVRQLEHLALSMHRDAMAALTGDAQPDCVATDDGQAQRIYAMIDRWFTLGLARLDELDALGMSRSALFELWLTARELQQVADHAEWVGAVASDSEPLDEPYDDDVRTIAQLSRDIVTDAVNAVVGDAHVESARHALGTRDRVREQTQTLERLTDEHSGGVHRMLVSRVGKTAEHGGNIAEIGLRQSIRRGTMAEETREISSN